ncbi:hypothetical protein GALMADRAFT_245845 [Galerina marginata CBS 339.88]|uniref:Terpene synthase n=1 Tax=Galerina marginata (strain CBS 339.88) TaxID=685588 RepID=A0A067T3G2_GALM3|nr:hypothetical protein GALMADRAFT_245845 [Galerina marginata CBS 339.88]
MSTPPQTYRLPRLNETFSVFPSNGVNPHFSECRAQSREWASPYYTLVFPPDVRVDLENCNFELVSAYALPYANPDGLSASMDCYNLTWMFDEVTDRLSGKAAAEAAAVVSRALRDIDYDNGTALCRMTRDYRCNHIEKFGSNVARRFIANFCQYVEHTATEAMLRERDQVLDINGYISLRRGAVGGRIVFDLVEYALGLDLPQYVHEDPVFIGALNAGVDLLAFTNDLFSYDMEQAKGHSAANIITVVMKSKGTDLQSAVDFVAGYCECLIRQLLDAKAVFTSHTDPVFSRDAARWLDGVGDWVRGNEEWCFATERYFGKQNKLVNETRIVELTKRL